MMVPYQKFEAWKVAHDLALKIHRITDDWPACERYQLTSQIRRAALSIPTNIAEGASKRGPRELILSPDAYRSLEELRDRAGKVMWGLYKSLSPKSSD